MEKNQNQKLVRISPVITELEDLKNQNYYLCEQLEILKKQNYTLYEENEFLKTENVALNNQNWYLENQVKIFSLEEKVKNQKSLLVTSLTSFLSVMFGFCLSLFATNIVLKKVQEVVDLLLDY